MNEPLLFEHSGWALCNISDHEADLGLDVADAMRTVAHSRGHVEYLSALPMSADRTPYWGGGEGVFGSSRDGTCLTHVGCKSLFPNWHLSVLLWDVYQEKSENRLICPDCRSVLSKEAYEVFCKVYNLLNRQ